MKSPVVVIDVQDYFIDRLRGDKEKYLDQVVRVVTKARKEDRFVFLVEYEGSGRTNSAVKEALRGYKGKARTITKWNDNGSKEVHKRLRAVCPDAKTLSVCGVNLDYCVMETVAGLIYLGYTCRILKEATTNTDYGSYTPADATFPSRLWANHCNSLTSDHVLKNARVLGVRYA